MNQAVADRLSREHRFTAGFDVSSRNSAVETESV